MLTLEAILKTTRQMTAYGEHGIAAPRDRQVPRIRNSDQGPVDGMPVRKWDDEKKAYVHV
jgi:hypothetical protein